MKKYFLPVLAVLSAIQFYSCNGKDQQEKKETASSDTKTDTDAHHKYGLASAIITYKVKTASMPGDITNTVYFDNYGERELTETSSNITVMGKTISTHTSTLVRDGYGYNWRESSPTGTKYKIQHITDPAKINYKDLSTDMMRQLGITKSGKENVDGKECEVYIMNKENVGSGKYWIWNNLLVKSEANMSGVSITMEMTDIQENAIIDDSVFSLPKDITFNEVSMPAAR